MNSIKPVFALTAFLCGQAIADEMPRPVRAVLETYCFDCHDDTTRKGKLSIESLALRLDEPVNAAEWTRAFDKLIEREMPPANKPQPTDAERASVADWLRGELHAASRTQQQREGRVVLRRMNRTEYEHTLQDMFGITTGLKELLPEDATVAGFDNVSAGLGISAAHLVRYQRAADKAIAAALAPPVRSGKERTTAAEQWAKWRPAGREDQLRSADLHQRYSARMAGDALVLHQQTESNQYLEMEFGQPSRPGRYRLRAKVSAKNTGGKPLPVLIFRVGIPREFNVNNARVIAVRDAPADTPTIIEEEFIVTDDPHLSLEKRIALKGWSLPGQKHPDEIKKDIAANKPPDFSGPGLAVEWVEMEGPLGDAPGYRLLFGDLPRGENGEPKFADAKADAAWLIRAFLPVAFCRPVDDETVVFFV